MPEHVFIIKGNTKPIHALDTLNILVGKMKRTPGLKVFRDTTKGSDPDDVVLVLAKDKTEAAELEEREYGFDTQPSDLVVFLSL